MFWKMDFSERKKNNNLRVVALPQVVGEVVLDVLRELLRGISKV